MSSETNLPLVSIIIPCYNAERWVQEAVESCLNQTYANIEVIVVDDGSTDRSLELLRRYQPAVQVETGPNRGGNNARNRGFALSKGEYIQFLDADDYLEPDKIAAQVQFLAETQADVVYGDFRSRMHVLGGRFSYLDKVRVSGAQDDIVASLLSFWIVNGGAVLYRRSAVERVGGWDEKLKAAQDTDFFTTVVLSGAKIAYQAGSRFVYRRYGPVTVSTSNLPRWVDNMRYFLTKCETTLTETGRLTERYRAALAVGHFEIARACYAYDPRGSFSAYSKLLDGLIDKILALCPDFKPSSESPAFAAGQSLFGLRPAMHILFRARAVFALAKAELRKTSLGPVLLRMRGLQLEAEGVRRPPR